MRSIQIAPPNLRPLIAALALAVLAACKVPADPEGTTVEVTGDVLKVGALTTPLDTTDAEAVRRISEAMQAQTELVTGDPHSLFTQLEEGAIHLVAGRIPANTPFAADVGLSAPIGRIQLAGESEDRVLAIRKGENRFLVTLNRAIKGMGK